MNRRTGLSAALILGVLIPAGCGLTPTSDLENIDPQSLPQRLIVTAAPTSSSASDTKSSRGGVYFVREDRLVELERSIDPTGGATAVQQLLDQLAAGPDSADRDRGFSTALAPATKLRLTGLDGDLATVDLTVTQLPPDQTTAIAQIVLTTTSLPRINRLRLTINGLPINAPLADGAQTDRPLTREDYAVMLAR